jgi:hypothetical protein
MSDYATDYSALENVATPIGRVHVELGGDGSYRIVEANGELCFAWLPWEEPDYLPIDRGGFDDHFDATGFALAIDLIRSEHRLISESPAQIEAQREVLDKLNPGPVPRKDPEGSLARFQDRIRSWGSPTTSLDSFAARALERMPVIEHRVLRRASTMSR